MDPATAMLILGAAGSAQGAAGSVASGKMNKRAEQIAREELAARKAAGDQDVALKESMLDPFRQQLSQAGAIGTLDRMERATYTPSKMTNLPSRYAKYVPQMTGGYSYQKSPELISSAASLKRNVMGGNVAPTMTNPANFGKTATLDLLRMSADGVDPGTVNAGTERGASGDYLADVGSPNGNGMGSRTPGLFGGKGYAQNIGRSQSAGTDVTVEAATQVLTQAITNELGRPPKPGEIAQMLASQGLKPGDRYVGQQGLSGLLASLQGQGTMRPSYTGMG